MAPKFVFARQSLDAHARAEALCDEAKTMPSRARDVIDHLISEWTDLDRLAKYLVNAYLVGVPTKRELAVRVTLVPRADAS